MSCKESKLSDAVEQMLLSRSKHNEHMENTLVEGIQEVLSKERELDLLMLKGVLKDFNEKLQQATDTDCESTHETEKCTDVKDNDNDKYPVNTFIRSVKFAVENGYGPQFVFGLNKNTLEDTYKSMLKMKEDGSDQWDHCIKEYEDAFYADMFMSAIDKAVKNGHGIKHKFGVNKFTLELAYDQMTAMQDHESKKWDDCIMLYQSTFIVDTDKGTGLECNNKCPVSDFIDSVQFSEKNGYGTQYKYGENNPHTLEHDYEEMIKLKKGGSDKWDDCLDKYEDAFYEYVFTSAIDKSLKDGHGIKHKFGMDNGTLENAYMEMVTWQAKGSKQFDSCIKHYKDAFIVDTQKEGEDTNKDFKNESERLYAKKFIKAINDSVELNHGINHKFGTPGEPIEIVYTRMRENKELSGTHRWDDCIKAYQDAFYDQSTGKFKGEQDYPDVKGHDSDKTDTDETNTETYTETDKVTDTVTPNKGKKKDGGKEEDGGKKNEDDEATDEEEQEQEIAIAKAKEEARAKQEAIDKAKAEQQAIDEAIAKEQAIALAKAQEEARAKANQDAIDDEERATINTLIDKVEILWKSGKYKYAEHDTYEPPETFEYRTARQGLISFYKEMLKDQAAGSDKWNPCIQKYQDTFIEHAFINLIKNGKGIDQKFGSRQNRLEDVYNGMLTVQANDEDEWDDCIITYQDKFLENSFINAIKRSKLNGMGIKYMFIKNKFTLEQFYKQLREAEGDASKRQCKKCLQAYEHNFGYDKNLIK